jgi:GR25 family glycosyltransferase involved in LPS biosynthesis
MNTVKVYIICKDVNELRTAKEQCDYIQKGGEFGRREGGFFNVKYILNQSYELGFIEVMDLIKTNQFMDFGLVLFGDEHLNRRLWTVVDRLAKELHGEIVHVSIGIHKTFSNFLNLSSNQNQNENTRHIQILAKEIITKPFTISLLLMEKLEQYQKCILQPCFISKTFLNSNSSQIKTIGTIDPPLCIPDHVYRTLPLVYFCHTKKNYIQSLSMIHYTSFPKKESIFNRIFDSVYCINLSSRNDRLLKFSAKMNKHCIKFERYNAVSKSFLNPFAQIVMPDDKFLSGCPNKSGLLGCLLSHMSVMKIALSRGQKQILIFEDDVSIHKDAEILFEKFIFTLQEHSINIKDIDILHLGYLPVIKKGNLEYQDTWSYRFLDHITGTVLNSKDFIGCHAYAVSEKFMKAYIDFYSNLKPIQIQTDEITQNDQEKEWPTNDWAIRNFFLNHKDFKCYAPCPQIFGVTPSTSDNSLLSEEDDIEKRITNTNFTYFDDYE